MKAENQVCTLEQAKKLKELGVECAQPQYAFVMRLGELRLVNVEEYNRWASQYGQPFFNGEVHYPAFTVAELGVMLPYNSTITGLSEHDKKTCAFYSGNSWEQEKKHKTTTYGETEAEARAAMLIYLLESDIIKVDEVNQRLTA